MRLPAPAPRLLHDGGKIRVAPFPSSLASVVQNDPEHLPGELRVPHQDREQHLDRLVRPAGLIPDELGKLPAAYADPHEPVQVHQPLGDPGRRQQLPEPRHELDLRLADLQPERPQLNGRRLREPGGQISLRT
jgi:hypothetical protein